MGSNVATGDIRSYIYDWNIRFPLDRWWRQKHGVSFNSPEHRESCFIDQLIEFEEDKVFSELYNKEKETIEDNYVAGQGNWLKVRHLSESEIDKAFDDLTI